MIYMFVHITCEFIMKTLINAFAFSKNVPQSVVWTCMEFIYNWGDSVDCAKFALPN